ncbi:hypothetical protein QE250_16850, partial [Chromatiaceae bacterium AAb-1]|nr:hypothetical protein [Chromatiaceae bacterium AAb-1]
SSGRHQSTETVISSITGGEVDVNVTGHTDLIGGLIAAMDENGLDTGKLNLNTGSLNIEHLTNRSYSSNQSAGVSANVAVSSQANPADPTQSNTNLALNSSNYSYQNSTSQSLDKTLATVGQGSIKVGGKAVEPEGLNRDIANLTKDIYDVDRQQGNIELTVDHRLLSEEGRKQIAEDVDEIRQKGQVAYIVLTEDESAARDMKVSAIDDSGLSWGDAKELMERDDVKAVTDAADKVTEALAWSSSTEEPPVLYGDTPAADADNTDSSPLNIVVKEGVDGKLKTVVDAAGTVAEKLAEVDPRIVAIVEVGLAAAQGIKGAAQYIAEKVLENTAIGEAWSAFTQAAGQAISNAATSHDDKSRAGVAASGDEASQQYIDHMDMGGTLLAGVAFGAAGSGG